MLRRPFSAFIRSPLLMEKIDVKVPSMGDSITEGTIVEWTASVGNQVKEGDVVALVETDKVTVDIKSDVDGVISAHYGSVDDNIEVGEVLYQIDTEAIPDQVERETQPDEKNSTLSLSEDNSSTISSNTLRMPSILFHGKKGWKSLLTPEIPSQIMDKNISIVPEPLTLPSIDPMYGRPLISDDEMEAITLGGANMIPKDML